MSVPFTIRTVHEDGFVIEIGNILASPATVFLELNRAGDFASDDTLLIAFLNVPPGSNSFSIAGLPNATPFYLRMYNPAAGGAYSPVQHRSTLPMPRDTSFAGYSIDPSLIVNPVDMRILNANPSPGTYTMPAYPPQNLALDDPQSTFQLQSDGEMFCSITFELSGEAIDTFAMLGTMAGPTTRMALNSYTDSTFSALTSTTPQIAFRASPSVGRRQSYHSLFRLSEPRTDKWWAIFITGPQRHFLARNFVVGLARQSTNASKSHGEAAADLGTAGRNRFGVIDGVPGWRGRTVDFELSWLREAEYHAKYADLPALVGTTKPVLALVNPKRNVFLQDRIAFGPLTSFRVETPASRRNTVTVEVNSLY